MFDNKVIPSNTAKDFYWTIKPIIFWMKIIGVNLKNDGLDRQPVLANLYSLLWLILHVYMFVENIIAAWDKSFRLPDTALPINITSTFSWTAIINDVNYNMSVLAIYCALLIKTSSNWPRLLESMRFQPSELSVSSFVREKNRKFTIFLVFYAISFELIVTIAATDTLTPSLKGIPFIQMILNVYPMGAVILFAALSRIIVENYRILQKKAEDLCVQWSLLPAHAIASKLQQWKFLHIKIFESVELLNSSFAVILLFKITYITISLVTCIFFITTNQFSDLPSGLQVNLTANFIKNVVNVTIICYASENITKEAKNTSKAIFKLNSLSSQILNQQIGSLALQTFHLIPRLSALGFFNVGIGLIVPLLGSTLTYLVILYQFNSKDIAAV